MNTGLTVVDYPDVSTGTCPCEPAADLRHRQLTELDAEMARLTELRAEMVAMAEALPSTD
jgi:hypothetical protein